MAQHSGQHMEGLSDSWGGQRAQRLLQVGCDLHGTWRPLSRLCIVQGQSQYVGEELASNRGHKQAGVSLKGEDGVQGT